MSPDAFELEFLAPLGIHTVQPVPLSDLVVEDPSEGQVVLPPPSVEFDGDDEYQVQSIEDSLMYGNQLQYLIRWTGYDSLTWEPVKFINRLQAVEEIHPWCPGKPRLLRNVFRGPRA